MIKSTAVFLSFLLAVTGFAESGIRLTGFTVENNKVSVGLSSPAGNSKWCSVGQSFEGYKLVGVDIDLEQVQLEREDGSKETLILDKAKVQKADMVVEKGSLIPLDKLDWAWIKSDLNPMKKDAPELPFETALAWNELTEAERNEIRNNYRRHGWDVSVEIKSNRIVANRFKVRDPNAPPIDPSKAVGAQKILVQEKPTKKNE